MTTDAARLVAAPFEVVGRFTDASNATLLVRFTDEAAGPVPEAESFDDFDPAHLAVYKPELGEAPLWDFPPGTLHRREVAAHVVSDALGWDLVPLTVLRPDAVHGPGSVQRFVAHDPEQHYFWLRELDDATVRRQLRRMVLFDLVIDNADRKGGHVMLEADSNPPRIQVVDHGVAFNVAPKLRTVAWDFADEPVDPDDLAAIERLRHDVAGAVGEHLAELLEDEEVEVLRRRIDEVLDLEVFPSPVGPRPFPWPLL